MRQRVYIGIYENELVAAAYIEKPNKLKFLIENVLEKKFKVQDIDGEVDYQAGFIQQQPRRLVLQKDENYAIFGFENMQLNKKKELSVSEERGTPFYCTNADELLSFIV